MNEEMKIRLESNMKETSNYILNLHNEVNLFINKK